MPNQLLAEIAAGQITINKPVYFRVYTTAAKNEKLTAASIYFVNLSVLSAQVTTRTDPCFGDCELSCGVHPFIFFLPWVNLCRSFQNVTARGMSLSYTLASILFLRGACHWF